MRHKKAVSMWKWGAREKRSSQQIGGIGRRFGGSTWGRTTENTRQVPGGEVIVEMCESRKYRKKHYWRTKDNKRMRKFIREILAFHPHDATPVPGPAGRWKVIVNRDGHSPVVSRLRDNDCKGAVPVGKTPQDTSYGKDLDFESTAQFNSRVASYAKD